MRLKDKNQNLRINSSWQAKGQRWKSPGESRVYERPKAKDQNLLEDQQFMGDQSQGSKSPDDQQFVGDQKPLI